MNTDKIKKLFISTLYLSTFTFGGGYMIITLLKKKFVDELHWIDEEEILDLVAIAQSSPGPIAVNGSIVIGYKIAGIPGIISATLGAIIPPFVILSVVSLFYQAFKTNFVIQALLAGMKSGVGAVIISVVYDMACGVAGTRDFVLIGIIVLGFIANYCLHINVIYIILAVATVGAVRTAIHEATRKRVHA